MTISSSTTQTTTPPDPVRTAWITLGVAFTVAALAGGLLLAWRTVTGSDLTAREVTRSAYDHQVSEVRVTDDQSGDVRIRQSSTVDRVEVVRTLTWANGVESAEPHVTDTWVGTELDLGFDCPTPDETCSVDYDVTVPAGIIVAATMSSGDITVTGPVGDVDLDSASGDIAITGATGAVSATTDSGDIRADALTGPSFTATATSGDVWATFTEAPDSVNVEATSGDVMVQVPEQEAGYAVEVATTSGDQSVSVDQSSSSPYAIEVQVTSGDILVTNS